MSKLQMSMYALFCGSMFAVTAAAAAEDDETRLTPACQVDRKAQEAEARPRSGFTFSFGGGVLGGGGRRAPAGGCDGPCPRERGSRSSAGAGVGIDLVELFRNAARPEMADRLSDGGPRFQEVFSLACVPVHGFVRGGWPLVIDYQAEEGTAVSVEIHVADRDPVVLPLPGGGERHLQKLELPRSLGDKLSPALFLVRAVRDQPGTPALGRLRTYGLGAGPRAVGSVAIDQVEFHPGELRLGRKDTANYSFHSRSDFNRAAAEILRLDDRNGDLQVRLARSIPIAGGLAAGTWVGREQPQTWDGTDGHRQVSLGPHLMQVRAWLSAQDGGDWVSAWSSGTVHVKP
mgnify:CR=1 FL=1